MESDQVPAAGRIGAASGGERLFNRRRSPDHYEAAGPVFRDTEGMPRPGIAPDTEIRQRDRTVPQYRVVLLDDNDHTYDYVIEMLQKLFYFSLDQAYQHAEEVDHSGRTVIITCELGEAEFARDQIHGYGRDPRLARSRGSMSALIEPAGC